MFIDGGWAMADVVQNAPKDVLGNTHIALMPSVAGGKVILNPLQVLLVQVLA